MVPPLVILGIAAHMNGTTLRATLSRGRVGRRTVIPVVLMTVSLAFIISEVENIVIHYLIPADLYRSYLKQFMDIFFFERPADLVLGLASIALVGPFMEEAVFRGVIFRGITSHRGAAYAVAASSVLFMVVHVNPLQFPGALISGLIYSTMISRGYRICRYRCRPQPAQHDIPVVPVRDRQAAGDEPYAGGGRGPCVDLDRGGRRDRLCGGLFSDHPMGAGSPETAGVYGTARYPDSDRVTDARMAVRRIVPWVGRMCRTCVR